jgi:hypothetical protein
MQDNGRARVFSGTDAALLHTVTGDAAGSKLGHAVAAVGDVDGDGRDEFLVTAWLGGENGGGEAALYSGATGTPLRAFEGEQHGDFFGAAASRAGDIDGDGIPDLIIGAYGADTHGVNSGSVYLLSGSDGTLIHVLHGEAAHDRFGAALAGVGDANGDGIDDLIVGAARAGGRGSAYLYSGADFRLLQRFDGDATGDAFGHAVASAGDLNADGLADIIIGAPGGGYATVFLSVPEPTALALLLGAGPMLLSRSRPRTRSESANSR